MFCFTDYRLNSFSLVPTSSSQTRLIFFLLKDVVHFFGSMYCMLGKVGRTHQSDSGDSGFCSFSPMSTLSFVFSMWFLWLCLKYKLSLVQQLQSLFMYFFLHLATVSLLHRNMVHGLVRDRGTQNLGSSLWLFMFWTFPYSGFTFLAPQSTKTAGFIVPASTWVPCGHHLVLEQRPWRCNLFL